VGNVRLHARSYRPGIGAAPLPAADLDPNSCIRRRRHRPDICLAETITNSHGASSSSHFSVCF
jgi:hypothetical protein